MTLAVGLAALTWSTKQGDRFFWLDNPIIRDVDRLPRLPYRWRSCCSWKQRPLLDLGLMVTLTFGWRS